MAKTSKKKKQTEPGPAAEALSFEQAVEELESIITRIEGGEIGLEESLAERKRGETLIRRTRAILDEAEQQLEELDSGELDADLHSPAADEPTTKED